MPRVRELTPEEVKDPQARDIYHRFARDYGPFLNQVKVFAHRPPALKHIMGLLLDLADEAILPKRYLEIALVTVSKLNECGYCVAHHAPRLTDQGFAAESADAILDEVVPGFDEVDHLVRDFARDVTDNFQYMRDESFDKLRAHFSEEQIVELTLRSALCGFFNRFNDVMQLSIEDSAMVEFTAKGGRVEQLNAAE